MVAAQQQRWRSFVWLGLLLASLVPCDAFVLPRARDIAISYTFRIRTPSVFLSNNAGRIKTAIATAAPDKLEFRSPKLADVDPIADLLVGTQLVVMADATLIAHTAKTHSVYIFIHQNVLRPS